mmetsp:Transcript_47063/g.75827  ORF Transcript_47063/g.75827 Transcript_47063/m.75827 type:complete len:119 (-) Transcript_47063:167-523(-)
MQEEGEDKEKGGGDKLKALVSKYGKVALLSHFSIQGFAYVAIYSVVSGMDVDALLQQLPEAISSRVDPSAGAFAVTFVLVKATTPIRLLIDAFITPKLADVLQNTPLAGPLGLSKQTP